MFPGSQADTTLAGVYGALQCKASYVSQPQGVDGSKDVFPYEFVLHFQF